MQETQYVKQMKELFWLREAGMGDARTSSPPLLSHPCTCKPLLAPLSPGASGHTWVLQSTPKPWTHPKEAQL